METKEINRRLLLDSTHHLTLVHDSIPLPGEDEVVVRIAANGICGSDIHFYREGRLGNFKVTVPYTPGHECSGTVVRTGKAVTDHRIGDRVVVEPGIPCGRCNDCKSGRYNLCGKVIFLSAPPVNGTLCDYLAIRSDMLHPIPDSMSFESAALAEPAAVAVHAVNRARVRNGADGVIVGAGPIGLLTLQAFKAAGGGRTLCIDPMKARLDAARSLGADETLQLEGDAIIPRNIGEYIFETAGNSNATAGLFDLAVPGGCVVQIGWPETNAVQMNIADFLDKELQYIAVNRYANAFRAAIAQIADGRIRTNELITHRFAFDDSKEAFNHASHNARETLKVMIIH
jgi:L-iditol 2-dehydrogenase